MAPMRSTYAAAAHEALESAGVRVDVDDVSCTSCGTGWYSARARRRHGTSGSLRVARRTCMPGALSD